MTVYISFSNFHIVSNKTAQIGQAIAQELGRDGTILSGQNLTAQADKKILFVVVDARRIPALRNIVLEVKFISICDAW